MVILSFLCGKFKNCHPKVKTTSESHQLSHFTLREWGGGVGDGKNGPDFYK